MHGWVVRNQVSGLEDQWEVDTWQWDSKEKLHAVEKEERLLQVGGGCFSIREGDCRDLWWEVELLFGFFWERAGRGGPECCRYRYFFRGEGAFQRERGSVSCKWGGFSRWSERFFWDARRKKFWGAVRERYLREILWASEGKPEREGCLAWEKKNEMREDIDFWEK